MRPTLKTLSAACAGALLFGCANIGSHAPPPSAPLPAAASADDAYVVGRQHHLAGRYALASASYQAALRANPAHVNASNNLAAVFAEQGEFGKAIALWQELIKGAAGAEGPATAFLYSNLGYAHFLSGDYAQALAALERACVLDPLNHRAWRHLGAALEKLGRPARAQLMYKQAGALETHHFKTDYTLAQRTGIAAIDSAVAVNRPSDDWAASEVRQSADGMFELRRSGTPAAPSMPAVAAAPAPALRGARAASAKLEIRNGNGVTGMARSLARKMGDPGVRVVRLSNQQGFNVKHTRVEYQGAYRDAANRLAARFGGVTVIEVENVQLADVRLVIGHDLVRGQQNSRRLARTIPAVATSTKAG